MFTGAAPFAAAEGAAAPPSQGSDRPAADAVSRGYEDYLALHAGAGYPETPAAADMAAAGATEGMSGRRRENRDGTLTALLIPDGEEATFPVTVPADGWYQIRVLYQAVPGKDIDITCALLIDGELPFASAAGITFTRTWKDSDQQSFSDEYGNEYRAVQVEEYRWEERLVTAKDEYVDGGCYFYFTAGAHSLTLQSVQEGILIGAVTLCQEEKPAGYAAYLDEQAGLGRTPAVIEADPLYLEGEDALYKSHATLYAIADYSSCITRPYDVRKSLLNTIGGENWSVKGQWLEWTFNIKTPGFYQLAFRYKQNYKSGSYSVRRLTLDGRVPFEEAASIRFNYGLGWDVMLLGGEEPAYLYLSAGEHTLRLEAAFGEFAAVCEEIQASVDELNLLYRQVMMITGATPDSLRDYNIGKLVPGCEETCRDLSGRLYAVVDRLAGLTGGKGSETAAIEKLAIQLEEFAKDVENIPQRLSAFNSNISSLASWLITATKQPLLLDYLQLSPVETPLPAVDAPWYKAVGNEVMRFFCSFLEDYDNIRANVEASEEPVHLWLSVGRDQATTMQSIITNQFTVETGIPINLRLIAMDVLMRAVASGVGPDLALYQDQATAINYALRNAAYDLNQFPDIEEVLTRFPEEATVPFRLDGGLYALPENLNYNVLFYRTDVMAELGLTVPETWEELFSVLAVLQKNKLEFGVLSSFTTTTVVTSATTTAMSPIFLTLLYQYGGNVYDQTGSRCILNDPVGVSAFTDFCELYTKHGLSLKIDLLTRFRTGEAPLVLNHFSFSNELSVSAPEINGLWKMAVLPGTKKEDGTIDHSTVLTTSGTVMFSNARNKENTWKFMKWWSGREAQVEFARQIEATQGRSGRWTSANLEAMEGIAWSREEMAVLQEQLASARALPEVAGGYYTGRSVNNAIRSVVNSKTEPKETLYEYVRDINKEIQLKRRELGLD